MNHVLSLPFGASAKPPFQYVYSFDTRRAKNGKISNELTNIPMNHFFLLPFRASPKPPFQYAYSFDT